MLCIVACSTIARDTIKIHQATITFGKHPKNGRHLAYSSPIIIIVRNKTDEIPTWALSILSKHTFIADSSKYIYEEGDEITDWLPEYKYDIQNPPKIPLLVRSLSKISTEKFSDNTYIIRKETNIKELANNPMVISIDSFSPIELFSRTARHHHFPLANIQLGKNITIATGDTGIDKEHASFYDPNYQLIQSQSFNPQPHIKIKNIITAIPGVTDYRGADGSHGTLTASAAAGFEASTDNIGVADGATLSILDLTPAHQDDDLFLPTSRYGMSFENWIEGTITITGASVFSFSFGAYNYGRYDSLSALLDKLAVKYPKVLFFVASGNGGKTKNWQTSSPCTAKNVICVGASMGGSYYWWHNENTQETKIADFTSHGPLADGRTSPLIFAPGVYEWVSFGYFLPIAGHNHQVRESGTSIATPHAAGVGAEIQSDYKKKMNGMLPNATYSTVLMLMSTKEMTGVVTTTSNVNPVKLLTTATYNSFGFPTITSRSIYIVEDEIRTGDSIRVYCGVVENTLIESFRSILYWRDPPAAEYTNKAIINNLMMFIIYKHVLIGEGKNELDNFQQIKNKNVFLEKDNWIRIVVKEKDGQVMQGPQWFALGLQGKFSTFNKDCGSCYPTDIESCGTELGNRYCNTTNGNMTECLLSAPEIKPSTALQQCSTDTYFGRINPETNECVAEKCRTGGYYYDSDAKTCVCLPGFRYSYYECSPVDLKMKIVESLVPVTEIQSGNTNENGRIITYIIIGIVLYTIL